MKKSIVFAASFLLLHTVIAQNVGIGTTIPTARLQLEAGTGGFLITGNADQAGGNLGTVPNLGAGARLMFYPYKSSFRAGTINGTQWDLSNTGLYSTAFGLSTTASGTGAFATGDHTVARGANAFVTGEYNDPILAAPQVASTNETPMFVVGNGNFTAARNALVTYKSGTTVMESLPGNQSTQILQLIENNAARFTAIGFYNKDYAGGLGNSWLMQAYPADLPLTTGRRLIFYTTGGANGGDILSIYGNGNAVLQGTLTQGSDASLKSNIRPLQHALDKIEAINGYNYNWKQTGLDSQLQAGVLAQEVQKVMPELVTNIDNNKLGVNYSGIIPYLIEGVKELKKQNDELQKQNSLLMQRVEKLEGKQN